MKDITKLCNKALEVTSNLAAIRQKRGTSAAELAAKAGVTRQAIYVMEAGTYVPNTAVGLRMARVLGVAVEDLFALSCEERIESVTLLPSGERWQAGQAVQLCKVNGKLMATGVTSSGGFLPASDATLMTAGGASRGTAKAALHEPDLNLDNRLLLAGCDPAMTVLARHLQPLGVEIVLIHQNSSQSLALLKHGRVHIAGTHLRDEASDESNLPAIRKSFRSSAAVISFAVAEEGLLAATGNPKQIKGAEDLARKDVAFVNREEGSGSRQLLDRQLDRSKVNKKDIRGYLQIVSGHLAAAAEVKSGRADCCVATEATARAFGLHFIPLASLRYDLVFQKQHLNLPAIQTLIDAMNRSSFRRKLESVGGYETRVTGARVM